MPTEWFYSRNGDPQGPVSIEELTSMANGGKLAPSDLVWSTGADGWIQARNVQGLFAEAAITSTLRSARVPPPPRPPNSEWLSAESTFESRRDAVKPTDRVYPTGQSPILMALVSGLCIAGLGQMMMGQVFKGFGILAGGILFSLVTGGFGAPVVWAFAGIDAYMIASKLKRGQSVGKWEFF